MICSVDVFDCVLFGLEGTVGCECDDHLHTLGTRCRHAVRARFIWAQLEKIKVYDVILVNSRQATDHTARTVRCSNSSRHSPVRKFAHM